MPPLASSLLDTQAIALVSEWISQDLAAYQTFNEWQIARFGAPNAPNAGPNDDADLDGANNQLEWLTGTDPWIASDLWRIEIAAGDSVVHIAAPQIANRGFEIQRTTILTPSNSNT